MSQESEQIPPPVENTPVETEVSKPTEKEATVVTEEDKQVGEEKKEENKENENKQVVETPKSLLPHPLQSRWTFWYSKKPKTAIGSTKYEDLLHKVGSFDTVPGFWKLVLIF